MPRLALAALLLAATPAYAGSQCQLGKVAELPVTMAGLRPLVPVTINGRPAQLLTDTGAFYSMLTPAAVARFGLHDSGDRLPQGFTASGVGGAAYTSLTTVREFGLAGQTIPQIQFLVTAAGLGGDAVGLLGGNVLGRFDTEIDLANGAIRLFHTRGCGKADLAYWAGNAPVSVVDMEPHRDSDPRAVIEVTVNGHRLRALLDTGAGRSVMSIDAARRTGIDPTTTAGAVSAGLSFGIGTKMSKDWIVPVDSFAVGGIQVNRTKLLVSDWNLDDRADMLLGDDFFLSTRVLLAYSQHKVYFTYNGGRMFDLRPGALASGVTAAADGGAAAPPPAEPTDADGFARRAAASLVRGDVDAALADYDRAVALVPTEARYLKGRAEAHARKAQPFLAKADLDAAIKLAPADGETLLIRARLDQLGHDQAGAQADLDAAAAAIPAQSDLRLRLAQLYLDAAQFPAAAAAYGDWLRYHEDNANYPVVLSQRCWARALGNVELDAARADCDKAVRRSPNRFVALQNRGFVELRQGDLKAASDDFAAALAGNPKLSWARYGLGLAEAKAGRTEAGSADMAAAIATNPKLPALAKRAGLGV